jgi:hypothetical protein
MATIVRYDPITGRVTDHIIEVNPAEWTGKPGTLIDPDIALVSTIPVSQWRVDTILSTLRPATPTELFADQTEDLEMRQSNVRESAIKSVLGNTTGDHLAILFRALLRVIAQEFARVKAGQNPRTALELWQAMKTSIQAGQADANL